MGIVSASENITDDNLGASEDINVTFDEQMWEEDLGDIEVDLPENSSGEFAVKIDDEIIYNQTITEKSFKVPVKLPKKGHEFYIAIWPPIDYRSYKVSAFYNNIDLNITTPLKVMRYSSDYNLFNFPQEILKGDKYPPLLVFPRSANGTVEFYIDERLFEKTSAKPTFYWENNPFSKLALGNHTFKVIYYGDSYYHAFNKTFNFLVTDVAISIPEIINIGHDDCISVKTSKNSKGNVKVYIDNRLIVNENTDGEDYILSLENYVKYTDNEIKVVYTSSDASRTKTKPLKMTYDLELCIDDFVYGNQNLLELYLPDTLNNKLLKITIDGKQYQFKRSSTVNNMLELDISNFRAGTYTLFMSYPDDGKFYPLNRTCNFTVYYSIHVPDYFNYASSLKVFLNLPKDANGNLDVYVDGQYFGSGKFSNGYAEVKIGSIGLGWHSVLAQYVGDDYNVSNQTMDVYVSPAISFDYEFTVGEDKYITVEVPRQSKGHVIFDINGKEYKVPVKNGKARYSLKNLKVGDYEIYVNYYGEDGFKDLSNWVEVSVKKAKFKVISAQATFKGINAEIRLLTKKGKALAGKWVTVKFNGKTYKIKTNKNGVLTFKKSLKLKKKHYTLKAYYMGAKFTKKLKVKAVDLKAIMGKKKLSVRVSVNKKSKASVVVKINSKKYLLKTNKKGIVNISIKKSAFKNAKRIVCKASYMKNNAISFIFFKNSYIT